MKPLKVETSRDQIEDEIMTTTIKTLKQAKQFGVITKGNSKIHGSTFSTDPTQCKTGSKLVNVKGSTCEKCYALKLSKVYTSALKSWNNNLESFRHHLENGNINQWCEAMAYQINHISDYKTRKELSGAGFHRWFTAGDLDSIEMLEAIIFVCKLTPTIKHWLPTRERGILRQFRNKLGIVPKNLVIRVSDTMVDRQTHLKIGFVSSSVHKDGIVKGFECPAYKNSGSCGDCSACWDSNVKNVSYKLH